MPTNLVAIGEMLFLLVSIQYAIKLLDLMDTVGWECQCSSNVLRK